MAVWDEGSCPAWAGMRNVEAGLGRKHIYKNYSQTHSRRRRRSPRLARHDDRVLRKAQPLHLHGRRRRVGHRLEERGGLVFRVGPRRRDCRCIQAFRGDGRRRRGAVRDIDNSNIGEFRRRRLGQGVAPRRLAVCKTLGMASNFLWHRVLDQAALLRHRSTSHHWAAFENKRLRRRAKAGALHRAYS